jgi:hypothetical protein
VDQGYNKLTRKQEQCVPIFLICRKFNVLNFYLVVAIRKLSGVTGVSSDKNSCSRTVHENSLRLDVNLCCV